MGTDDSTLSRRHLLGTASSLSLVGLAGCLDATTNVSPKLSVKETETSLPEGYETCVDQSGGQRDPDSLSAKDEVQYQNSPAYTGESGFIEMCANCKFYCSGGDIDANVGACSQVEGKIGSQHWCALWQPVQGLEEQDRSGARGASEAGPVDSS